MSDRFEDAVRDAAQGLSSPSGELATYHGAWHRGRRRRLVKRSALAAASVVVLVAALAVNLGRIPGSGTSEIDDVATSRDRATATVEPTPLATTSPIETPDTSPASSGPQVLPVPTSTPEPAPTLSPVQEPTAATVPAPSEPGPTTPAPNPTAVPTATPGPQSPTAVPEPSSVETNEPDPAAIDSADTGVDNPPETDLDLDPNAADPNAADPNAAAGTTQQPDPEDPELARQGPQPAFTGPGPADAVILDEAPTGTAIPCDLDGDFVADASCELLAEYGCTGNGDVRPGYTAVDSNGDQVNDTCIARDTTRCDTVFDGAGDTPCIIELFPQDS